MRCVAAWSACYSITSVLAQSLLSTSAPPRARHGCGRAAKAASPPMLRHAPKGRGKGKRRAKLCPSHTHVDVVLQQLVRRLVVGQNVVVAARARKRGAKKEAEESSKKCHIVSDRLILVRYDTSRQTNPPRNAPIGLRAGRGAATSA